MVHWTCFPTQALEPSQKAQESFQLVDPAQDVEIRPLVTSLISQTTQRCLYSQRFQRFSTWDSLLRAVALLIHVARSFKSDSSSVSDKCKGWHWCDKPHTLEELAARNVIIKSAQEDTYAEELRALEKKSKLPHSSPLVKLNPVIQWSV